MKNRAKRPCFSTRLPEHHVNIPLLFNREYMGNMAQQLNLIRLMEK
jgi:hypothetical protein